MIFKMQSVESPRTPPPSRESRHSPVLSRGLGSPPYIVDVACSIFQLLVGVVVDPKREQRCREDYPAVALSAHCQLRRTRLTLFTCATCMKIEKSLDLATEYIS